MLNPQSLNPKPYITLSFLKDLRLALRCFGALSLEVAGLGGRIRESRGKAIYEASDKEEATCFGFVNREPLNPKSSTVNPKQTLT